MYNWFLLSTCFRSLSDMHASLLNLQDVQPKRERSGWKINREIKGRQNIMDFGKY